MSSIKQNKLQKNSIKYFVFNISPFFKFKVLGHSMEPLIRNGDVVFINRIAYLFKKPHVGDVVAAKINEKIFVKRITKVEKNKFFLSGDNSHDSFDSRKFGMIAGNEIIGKVILK